MFAFALSGCATITGTLTGAVTGFVDLPREIVRENDLRTDDGDTWLLAMVAAPVGCVGGPVFGFIKGIALDVSTLSGTVDGGEAFGGGRASIWRPYTFGWNTPASKH